MSVPEGNGPVLNPSGRSKFDGGDRDGQLFKLKSADPGSGGAAHSGITAGATISYFEVEKSS